MKNTKSFTSFNNSRYLSEKHSTYFETYDRLFSKYVNKPITFVEIGVLEGGSLFMWRDFFGPDARIIGIELNPNAKKWEDHGFEIFIGSQSDKNFWNKFQSKVGNIDVLLDDGGHTYEQQIITTEMMLNSINDGGMLVVEDTHTSYMNGFGPKKYSFMKYVYKMSDAINSRFKTLSGSNGDQRVLSIEIFESIVAFHVDKKKSSLKSFVANNEGISDKAEDVRHEDNSVAQYFYKMAKRFYFLRNIPIVKNIGYFFFNLAVNKRFKAKKYFK